MTKRLHELRRAADGARPATPPARAFSLVELLIVLTVVGILASLVLTASMSIMDQNRATVTRTLMQNLEMAIGQYSELNPLRTMYDSPGHRTFGALPPYQLYDSNPGSDQDTVPDLVEPAQLALTSPHYLKSRPETLQQRLSRDLSGFPGADPAFASEALATTGPHTDNLSLYAYLKTFSPGVLESFPAANLAPIGPDTLDPPADPQARGYVNPSGNGAEPGRDGARDVLGFVDAWGVPLDYMIYTRIELLPTADQPWSGDWVVVERLPAVRSRGIDKERYEVGLGAWRDGDNGALFGTDRSEWIFSRPLPAPVMSQVSPGGDLPGSRIPDNNGWIRVRAAGEGGNDYGYIPAYDGG